jgi:hypothetical protein
LGYQTNIRELVAGGINPQDQELVPLRLLICSSTPLPTTPNLNIPSGDNNLVLGLNGAIINNEADESKPNVPMPDAKINDIGLYAIGDFKLAENLTLTTGLRYDYRNMKSFPCLPQIQTDLKLIIPIIM